MDATETEAEGFGAIMMILLILALEVVIIVITAVVYWTTQSQKAHWLFSHWYLISIVGMVPIFLLLRRIWRNESGHPQETGP